MLNLSTPSTGTLGLKELWLAWGEIPALLIMAGTLSRLAEPAAVPI